VNRLDLYGEVAHETAGVVIRRYSTSFGLASRLLAPPIREHIENFYALVRIADEIVDGAAAEAGLDVALVGRLLNELERETDVAITSGFSTNLVVHAFAKSAREVGFGSDLTHPFFDSMRMDISLKSHDEKSFARYVFGSAEVVGLMCLRAFLHGVTVSDSELRTFERGAQALGAAFQKVNFLRDLGTDVESLGRSYFPGVDPNAFTEADKNRLLDDIDTDLAVSGKAIPGLPKTSRRAVVLAHSLFAELSRRLRSTPAASVISTRVRVPNPVKARIAVAAAFGGRARQ
jgi:15-cis-phytoene synthase